MLAFGFRDEEKEKIKNTKIRGNPEKFFCMRGSFSKYYGRRDCGVLDTPKRPRGDPDVDSDSILLSSDDEVAATAAFLSSPELKYFDTQCTERTVPSSLALDDWEFNPDFLQIASVPPRGDGGQQMSGKAIRITSWSVKGSFWLKPTLNALEGLEPRWGFIALVLDSQTNGARCSSEEVFQFFTSSNNLANCSPFMNMLNSKRFRLLRRLTVDLSPKTLSIDIGIAPDPNAWQCAGRFVPFEFFVPLDLICNFNAWPADGNDQIVGVVDNSLQVFAGTNHLNPLLSNQPAIVAGYQSRIRFLNLQ